MNEVNTHVVDSDPTEPKYLPSGDDISTKRTISSWTDSFISVTNRTKSAYQECVRERKMNNGLISINNNNNNISFVDEEWYSTKNTTNVYPG